MFKRALEQNNNNNITHTFLLTINSNKAARTEEEAENLKRAITKGLGLLFSSFEDFVDIYLSGTYSHKRPANVEFSDVAHDIKVNPQIEIGTKLKRVHTHIIIKWDSSPKYFFQINMRSLKIWLENNLGPVYCNVRWVKGDSEIFRYINKAQ
jgi:hypothetical protein